MANEFIFTTQSLFKMKLISQAVWVWRCYEMRTKTLIFPSRSPLFIYMSPEHWALPLILRIGNSRGKEKRQLMNNNETQVRTDYSGHKSLATLLGVANLSTKGQNIYSSNILEFSILQKDLNLPFSPLKSFC